MEFAGEIRNISTDWVSGETQITFSIRDKYALLGIDKLRGKVLNIVAKELDKKKSREANGYFWKCITLLAEHNRVGLMEQYVEMLAKYGNTNVTYIRILPETLASFQIKYREVMVVEPYREDGMLGCNCYDGLSHYSSKELSALIDRVLDEMVRLGVQPPPTRDMQRSIDECQRNLKNRSC